MGLGLEPFGLPPFLPFPSFEHLEAAGGEEPECENGILLIPASPNTAIKEFLRCVLFLSVVAISS